MVRITLAAVAALSAALLAAPRKTPLDEYVARPDPAYSWKLVNKIPGKTTDAYILELISQVWGEGKQIDRTRWEHTLTIVKPHNVTATTASLFITGGSNGGSTRNSVAELRNIPNQPVVFADDKTPGRKRSEDAIIAYTWRKYLESGDSSWPLRLPMTKAAVRAMDAVQAFLASPDGGGVKIDKFHVSGGSKRGWTSWTTAAVDSRVVGLTPIVIDMLNVIPSFVHHYRAYGFWAPSVGDYFAEGVMDQMNNPRYKELMKIVEPYEYRDRLTQPKFILNAGGDQFFLTDSWKFYWKDLKGEKHLRYVPNTDHSMRNSDALESAMAFSEALIHNKPRPRYSWDVKKDGTIELNTVDKPTSVKLWQATNPDARDFRLETLGPKYTSTDLQPVKPGRYSAKVQDPPKGYTVYFIEMTFPSTGKYPFKFTTGSYVTPDTYPFPAPVPGQTKVGPRPVRR
jgi:PhoPQ-activated pathogenicity-related protein